MALDFLAWNKGIMVHILALSIFLVFILYDPLPSWTMPPFFPWRFFSSSITRLQLFPMNRKTKHNFVKRKTEEVKKIKSDWATKKRCEETVYTHGVKRQDTHTWSLKWLTSGFVLSEKHLKMHWLSSGWNVNSINIHTHTHTQKKRLFKLYG